jgi:hypothetical protein
VVVKLLEGAGMNRLGLMTILFAAACSISEQDLDEEAAAAGADGKADTYSFTPLERATPTQVSKTFQARVSPQVIACFDAYRSKFDATATMLSSAVADKFKLYDVHLAGCDNYLYVGDYVIGVLGHLGKTEATPTEVVDALDDWAKPKLQDASVSGYVQVRDLDLNFYDDLMTTRDVNARAKEVDPTGIDIGALVDQYHEVRDWTTLDRAWLNPVKFPAGALDGPDIWKYLRAAFPLRGLSLVSTYYTAVRDFSEANEGPEGDPAFDPIATALRKQSIKKRFYYAGGGEYYGNPWSSNVMLVVDEHGQAWGMQMGYSE